jgi:hypothetical protein
MVRTATLEECVLLCDLDRELLADASEGRPAPELFERAVAAGWDPLGVHIRLRILKELHFLRDDE